ncbi:MAG: redox-sensing transcriptional repressor Rex [Oscillospiraceae bacterium]|nr:redox-sensing transcriptional repressor Rex [Oscillospiraceae bacterium]
MKRSNISENVIRRLPRYLRKLKDLAAKGEERISSEKLGKQMGLTPSQIRQDFSCFGEFGQQGYGYNIESLSKEIGHILGTYQDYSAILVGAGNLGGALIKNLDFIIEGYRFLGAFDVKPELIGTDINGVPVYDYAGLSDFIRENKVDIAILTVPKEAAQTATEIMMDAGIRAIWNFTNRELELGDSGVLVENIHFSDSLLVLTYHLSSKDEEQK